MLLSRSRSSARPPQPLVERKMPNLSNFSSLPPRRPPPAAAAAAILVRSRSGTAEGQPDEAPYTHLFDSHHSPGRITAICGKAAQLAHALWRYAALDPPSPLPMHLHLRWCTHSPAQCSNSYSKEIGRRIDYKVHKVRNKWVIVEMAKYAV